MAIGRNSEDATEVLRADYKPDLTIKGAIDLAMKALSKAEESNSPVEVGIAYDMTFRKMSLEEANKFADAPQ